MADDKRKKEEFRPAGSEGPGEEQRSILSYLNPLHNVVYVSHILLFTKYFATLTRAGIPVLRSLATLSKQMTVWRLKSLVWKMREEVEGGLPLHQSFKKNEDIFGMLYVNLIKVGEESGRLFAVLDRLSGLLERSIRLRRKVMAALTYPAIITLVAVGVVSFLMLYVIPQFSKLFEQFGQELPWPTQLVITISNFLTANIINISALLMILSLVMYQVAQTEGGKRFFDGIKLRTPLFGGLVQKYSIAMFARNLASLFQSGVPIISSMKISIESVENTVLADALSKVVREIEGGIPIAKAIARVDLMPDLSTQMIEVGEESGNLDEMLEKVADFYEDEINFIVDQLASMIEPIFIVVLGSVVGGIVLAMYLPIFRMARVVSGGSGSATAPVGGL
jgi:type IV pilus assembly protein PilC